MLTKGLQYKYPEQQDFIAKFNIASKIIAVYATLSFIVIFLVVQIASWILSRFVFSAFAQATAQGGGL